MAKVLIEPVTTINKANDNWYGVQAMAIEEYRKKVQIQNQHAKAHHETPTLDGSAPKTESGTQRKLMRSIAPMIMTFSVAHSNKSINA